MTLNNKKIVGIFRTAYLLPSETFISEQLRTLESFSPVVLTRDNLGSSSDIIYSPRNRITSALWTLTRSPSLFPLRNLRDVRLLHAHFAPDAYMALPIAKRLNIPLVATFHGADVTVSATHYRQSKRLTDRLFTRGESELQRKGTAFIAVSKFIENKLIERGYPKEAIHQIYIGVDTSKFNPRSKLYQKDYVICVGRHTEKKGIAVLLRAWAKISNKHPNTMLYQIGSGTLTASLHNLAEELGIADSVKFLGALPHSEVVDWISHARAFALPSQRAESGDSEGLGIVFNEASACSIPILSTRHGGIPEAVIDRVTGLLSDEGDVTSLADNLDHILSDAQYARRLGEAGRAHVEKNFNLLKQSQKLETVYRMAIFNYRNVI